MIQQEAAETAEVTEQTTGNPYVADDGGWWRIMAESGGGPETIPIRHRDFHFVPECEKRSAEDKVGCVEVYP